MLHTNVLHPAMTSKHEQARYMLCNVPSLQSHTSTELCKVSLNAEIVNPANLHDVCAIPSCASQGSAVDRGLNSVPIPLL